MSKPMKPGEPVPFLSTDERLHRFADAYRPTLTADAFARFQSHMRELGLNFEEDELTVLAALDTPARVQEFLNTQVYYNFDHSSVEQDETAQPPRTVLRTGVAHCFEGAVFAFAVDWLHGHAPRWALLEASQDSEHNLVVMQDRRSGLYGCNAHSAEFKLDGRPCAYESVRALAESYHPYYFSDRTRVPTDYTVVGFSDPFDFVARFGYRWMDSQEMLWDIYYTYIDDTITFHYLFDDSGESHPYPVLRALKEGWIQLDGKGRAIVDSSRLPSEAQELWAKFWERHGDNRTYRRPRGEEAEIERRFMRLTGTTPIDLDDNAFDLQFYLAAGYRVEDLIRNDRLEDEDSKKAES